MTEITRKLLAVYSVTIHTVGSGHTALNRVKPISS